MTDHDLGYKRLFSHPEMIRDLLQGFVAEPWIAELDFSTLEKYPTVFVSDHLKERRDDVIWRVKWGAEYLYIYVLLEFQSSVNRYMAVRLMDYLSLLYQDLVDAKQITKDRKLPPVLPIVLYNGQRRWTAPIDIAELIAAGPEKLVNYRPQLRYLLIDESAYADTNLATQRNLVAALFRLEASRDPQQVREVLTVLVDWLQEPEQQELRHSFLVWLKQVFLKARLPKVELPELHDLEEMRAMLAERVVEWTEQWKMEGLREGLESERRALLRLIRRRFGEGVASQSQPMLAQIHQPTVFEELFESLFDCPDEPTWLARLSETVASLGTANP